MPKKEDLLKEQVADEEIAQTEADQIEDADELEEAEAFHEDIEEEAAFKGTDEIFPFGPTYDQVQDWKSRYNDEIYMSDFSGEVIIWRPIRRKEYRDLQRIEGNTDEYYLEEAICRTCVVWPEDYAMQRITFGKAGIPSTLSQLIMERFGFLRPAVHKI